jgi:ABC-type dipeptide/oligopeptide/nickel transport system permease component
VRILRIVLRRSLVMLPVLLGVSVVTFALTRVLPGSPIEQLAGPMSTREQRQALLEHYGLDRPLWVQYLTYVQGVARGDFGASFVTGRPVAADLRAFFPATLELTTCAIVLAALLGVPLGVAGAVRRGSWLDHVTRVVSVAGVAVPLFWLSLVMIYVFFFQWQLLPAPIGRLSLQVRPPPTVTDLLLVDTLLAGDLVAFRSAVLQLVLPVLVLAFGAMAPLARMARASMIDVLDSPHVRATRALGIPWRSVVWTYALKNAILPVLTMLAIVYGYLLGGSVLVENLFAWPGLGRYAFTAIAANDYPAVQGFILYSTVVYLLIFVLLDVLYASFDPRIEV